MGELEPNAISRDVIKSVAGDMDEDKLIEIAEFQPTLSELEQAVTWATGNGEVLGKSGHEMTDRIAHLVSILTAGEEDDPLRPN